MKLMVMRGILTSTSHGPWMNDVMQCLWQAMQRGKPLRGSLQEAPFLSGLHGSQPEPLAIMQHIDTIQILRGMDSTIIAYTILGFRQLQRNRRVRRGKPPRLKLEQRSGHLPRHAQPE